MTPDRWKEIERLYHEVKERGPKERDALLAKACAEDPSLRAEVESLLACRPEAGDFLEAPALDVAARAIAQEQARPSADLTGQSVLHYRILKKIGSGDGCFYRAHDDRLRRDVAIKVLPDHFAHDPERMARFEREAKLLGIAQSPRTSAIFGSSKPKASGSW